MGLGQVRYILKYQTTSLFLRLNTARSFVRSLQTSSNPISTGNGDESESIKLSAQVLGLGPVFKLVIGLCNTSTSTPSRYLLITFYCDDKMYRYEIDETRGIKIFTFCEREKNIWIFRLYYSAKKTTYSNTYHISLLLLPSSLSKNMIRVPMLVPGLEYTFEIQVECISDLGISDQLHVFVTRDQVNKCRTICIVSTILIKMSENLIDADDATYSGSREIYGI